MMPRGRGRRRAAAAASWCWSCAAHLGRREQPWRAEQKGDEALALAEKGDFAGARPPPAAPRTSTRCRSSPTSSAPRSRTRPGDKQAARRRSSTPCGSSPRAPRRGGGSASTTSTTLPAGPRSAGAAGCALPRPVLAAEPQSLRGRASRRAVPEHRSAPAARQERAPEQRHAAARGELDRFEAERVEQRRQRPARVEAQHRLERVVMALEGGERRPCAREPAVERDRDASRPPGASTRRTSDISRCVSATCWSTWRQTTTSNARPRTGAAVLGRSTNSQLRVRGARPLERDFGGVERRSPRRRLRPARPLSRPSPQPRSSTRGRGPADCATVASAHTERAPSRGRSAGTEAQISSK